MNRQTIIAIVLGIIAVVMVGWQLVPLMASGPPPPPPPPAGTAGSGATATLALLDTAGGPAVEAVQSEYDHLIAGVDKRNLEFLAAELRNPFRPLVGPGSLLQEQEILDEARRLAIGIIDDEGYDHLQTLNLGYSVNGIIWTDDGPLALVNDQVLGVGEEIEEGGIITAITAEAVVFTFEGQSLMLPIGEE